MATFELVVCIILFVLNLGSGRINNGVVASVVSAAYKHDEPYQTHDILYHETTYYYQQQVTPGGGANVSQQCQQDLDDLLLQNSSSRLHALDAFGKPGSGILVGDLVWLGTYEECQDLEQFHYCLVDLSANVSGILPPTQQSSVLPIRWGTCFPESCSDNDVFNGIPQVLDGGIVDIPFPVKVTHVQCSNPVNKWADGIFVFTVVLCCILICLMLSGYGLDLYLRQQDKIRASSAGGYRSNNAVLTNGPKSDEVTPLLKGATNQDNNSKPHTPSYPLPLRFLLCFAVNRNLTKLLDTHQNERSILCLNGIRCLSMFWVILGHTCSLILYTQLVDNLTSFAPTVRQFGFQAILNATFAVDTFFLLSGMLVTLGCINRMEKNNGKIPWLWFYFHRYWRLTPALLFVILITISTPYFANGPAWQQAIEPQALKCEKYWWSTILYVNNFYPGFAKGCVGHTWYLANDMQFFIVSPVFIILLYKFRKIGIASIAVTCLTSFALTIGLAIHYDFNLGNQALSLVGGTNGKANLGGFAYQDVVYQKPYCRISVYLVGMVMGLIIQRHRRIRLSKIIAVMGWLVATLLAMLVVYGLYPTMSQTKTLQPVANALYAGLSRFAWGVAVSWVIFACYFGYGGPINHFLSWRGWVPISRLTYTAYLIHITLINVYYVSTKVSWHISLLEFSVDFVGFLGLTYGAALLFSLAVEYPFANMEKLFLPSRLAENSSQKTAESAGTLEGTTNNKSSSNTSV